MGLPSRLQQDVFKLAPKKLAVGMKYLGETHAANFMFDTASLTYSVGLTRCVRMLGSFHLVR